MKCPECANEGEQSRVYVGGTIATLMATVRFYDEEGRPHDHDPNTYTRQYHCSRGHFWAESERTKCWCQ